MRVISIMNYKGGVGKTTLALNLAAELAFTHNQRVLIIDLDPQTNLTFSCVSVNYFRRRLEQARTIKNWYDAFLEQNTEVSLNGLIVRPPRLRYNPGYVELVASHLGLINVDFDIALTLVGATQRQRINRFMRVFSRLKQGLTEQQVTDSYDLAIIDCPPNFNVITRTAIVASDGYFIPTRPDYLSILGIEQLNRNVTELTREYNRNQQECGDPDYSRISPRLLGIILSMVKIYRHQPINDQREHIRTIQGLNMPILRQRIRNNNRFYTRRTDERPPLVIQEHGDPKFREIRTELETLTAEVMGIINTL